MPLFRDTVTLYHHLGGERWQRTVLRGVLWRQKREHTAQRAAQWERTERSSDPRMALLTTTSVRVPASLAAGLAVSADGLDVLVHGACARELGESYTLADLRRDEPTFCTVRSLLDATGRARLPQLILTAV